MFPTRIDEPREKEKNDCLGETGFIFVIMEIGVRKENIGRIAVIILDAYAWRDRRCIWIVGMATSGSCEIQFAHLG